MSLLDISQCRQSRSCWGW